MAQQPLVGKCLLTTEASLPHSDTPHSVGILWTSVRSFAETCTWQHTKLAGDRYPCPRQDYNTQSQQPRGRRPTPYTARPLGSAIKYILNPSTPKDHYSGRTAPLTSKRFILYIYLTNKDNEYFKRGIYTPFFSLQNAVCFIILTYLVPVLFTFYIQGMLK